MVKELIIKKIETPYHGVSDGGVYGGVHSCDVSGKIYYTFEGVEDPLKIDKKTWDEMSQDIKKFGAFIKESIIIDLYCAMHSFKFVDDYIDYPIKINTAYGVDNFDGGFMLLADMLGEGVVIDSKKVKSTIVDLFFKENGDVIFTDDDENMRDDTSIYDFIEKTGMNDIPLNTRIEYAEIDEEDILFSSSEDDNKTYIANAFSLQMLPADVDAGSITYEVISEDDFNELKTNAISCVGHQDTAKCLDVECNRTNISLTSDDVLIVAQLQGGRLPEGATSLPDGFSFKFIKIILGGE